MNRKQRRAAQKQAAPGVPMAARFDQAMRQHHAGQWSEADATCAAILARDPRHIGSLHLRGFIAHQSRRFEEAANLFRKLIALRPEIAAAHQALGGALAAGGNLAGAAEAFEQALKLGLPAAQPQDTARGWLDLGNLYNQLGRLDAASRAYQRALELVPDHAEAHNGLGAVLLAQGQQTQASTHFARSLVLAPELFETYSSVSATLRRANPVLDEAVRRAVSAWPDRPRDWPEADAFAAMAGDPMLLCMLESATVRDLDLEKFLTGLRALLLETAVNVSGEADQPTLRLACALARQCFINEYLFSDTPAEIEQVERLKQGLRDLLTEGRAAPPLWLAALAGYTPLSALDNVHSLLARDWPEPVRALLNQQILEPDEEQRLQGTIPRLTAIATAVSEQVRQQYEENPYPRWVLPPSRQTPVDLDEYLVARLPNTPYQPLGRPAILDILIAGCGTGEHPIGMAQRFRGARVLAIDLSLASLGYAARKTAEFGVPNVEYAQADILELAGLGRSFDLIDASGVLHHLAEPAAGWRQLLPLLKPRGLMRIGLYSEIGRADIVAARRFIAERGFQPVTGDIRRCRRELLQTPLRSMARYRDFYSISECRDLMFHVQEQRMSLPQIRDFLAAQNLRFLGFELDAAALAGYRASAPDDASATNLDRWHAFESGRPDTFTAMYQFWCQRA